MDVNCGAGGVFLLGEERYRQPRAVYKYWVGDLRSCYHAATSSSSSSSSTSVSVLSGGHSCYAAETGIRSATVQVVGSVHSCFLADEVAAALVVDIGSCMFRAGFASDHAIRAVFLLIGTLGDDFKIVSVFSAELGSTADTCTASVYGAFEEAHIFSGRCLQVGLRIQR